MPPTTEKTEKQDEKKLTLPPGHPDAGYVRSDTSLTDEHTGTLPPELQEWHDKRDKAREEQVKAVAEQEDKAVREERKQAEEDAKKRAKEAEEPTPPPKAS